MSELLRKTRLEIVCRHVDAESRGDWDAALATFARARYEVVPMTETHDGSEAVARFYDESRIAFADIAFDTRAFHEAGPVIVHEVVFRATHAGTWRGLPATGRRVSYGMLNVFEFEEDRLVCERMYFDVATILRQVGIARDPTSLAGRLTIAAAHPLTVGAAFLRQALHGSPLGRDVGRGPARTPDRR
jgi:steroid delta-isomerase-like uncharacterized protein